jgi:hypothetical protein
MGKENPPFGCERVTFPLTRGSEREPPLLKVPQKALCDAAMLHYFQPSSIVCGPFDETHRLSPPKSDCITSSREDLGNVTLSSSHAKF